MNFFNLLSELDLNKYTYIKNYKAGDIIFNAGSICDKIGLIVSGEASIITITHTEKEETISYLKQGERLPGGRAAIYLANNMIRLDDGTKLKADSTFGIDGCIVDVQMVKSRTNKVGRSIPLIFSYTDGCFDPELSLFQLLKSEGKINGSGVGMYIGDRNDIKFSHKNFKEKLIVDKELQQVFSDACYEVLYSLLSVPEEDEENINDTNSYSSDVSNLILNKCNILEAA